MKPRRALGPKKIKNKAALKKFILLAVLAAVIGTGLAIPCYYQIDKNPSSAASADKASPVKKTPSDSTTPEQKKVDIPFFQIVFVLVITITMISVLGLVFFGVRAYMIGIPTRKTITRDRIKVKRS